MLQGMTVASNPATSAPLQRRTLWFWTGAFAALASVISKPVGPNNLIAAATLIGLAAIWSRGRGFATFPAGVAVTAFLTFLLAEIHDHGLTVPIAIVIAGASLGLSAVVCTYLLTRHQDRSA
jgi:hypothetical protein